MGTYFTYHTFQPFPIVRCTTIELFLPAHLPAYAPHFGWSGTPLSHSSNFFLKYSVELLVIFLICSGMQLNSLSIFLAGLCSILVSILFINLVQSFLYSFIPPSFIHLFPSVLVCVCVCVCVC